MTSWVLIDETAGATTQDGSLLAPDVLAHFVEAVSAQLNGEFAREHGGSGTLRVGSGPTDVQPGESVYAFVGLLPDAPGASAYHDTDGKGVPVAYCAVRTCGSLYGPTGVSVDVSHEVLEAALDPGCNLLADDGKGTLHAVEACDAVEVNTYPFTCADFTVVQLSDWLLGAWFVPGSPGPYSYAGVARGSAEPAGPLETALGNGGNYQITCPSTSPLETETYGAHPRVSGHRRKGLPHWSSRAYRRGAR